jgi:hypothetical protein
MNDFDRPFRESLIGWFGALKMYIQAALSVGVDQDDGSRKAGGPVDPEFEGWLQNDPMVTGNPASRYRSQPPGYLTSNGRGSLEIGAAED